MLYQYYEAQRALLNPFSEFASASSKLYRHPLSPFAHTPMAHRVSAGLDLMHRLYKEYEKPPFAINSVNVDGVEMAVQEQVALAKPFCRLLRFKRYSDDLPQLIAMKDQPTVLVVAPLSGHHSTLLRDTVRALLQHHKVYVTDWTDARMVPIEEGPFSLDDYVAYVQEFIRHIGSGVNVISVCQPTVPVLAAVSLMASNGEATPRTMTMMGGPIDARRSPTAVNNLATNKKHDWFEHNVIYRVPPNYPGAGRRVYPGFMQHSGFMAMNPDRHVKSHYDYFLHLVRGDGDSADSHRSFYDEYNAVLDMPAEYYLDTIKIVFQEFSLVNGTWEVNGQLVRPAGHHRHAAADDRGRARRHLGRGPDQGGARPVQRHPAGAPLPLRRGGRGPLRHLLGPSLAREGLPGDAQVLRQVPRRRLRGQQDVVARLAAVGDAPDDAVRPAEQGVGRRFLPPRELKPRAGRRPSGAPAAGALPASPGAGDSPAVTSSRR